MPSRQRCAAVIACLAGAAVAQAQPSLDLELPSCVAGSPPLSLSPSAERAPLDGPDRQRFEQAAQARYPAYQRGGLVPAQVLIVRRAGGWQYVTILAGGSSGTCFSAVFAAERFDFTRAWLAKYRPSAAESDF